MNLPIDTAMMTFANNSARTIIESWFIPIDIFMIVCTTFAIVLILILLSIMVIDKTCHTVPMILVVNSCLAELIFGSSILWMAIFTLQNDLKQIQYQDSLCVFRAYLMYASCALQYYSYLLQAIYRYVTVVYPLHFFWQSSRCQVLLISLTWIFAFVYPIPFVFYDKINYNVDNQICQMPLELSFLVIYMALCVFTIPIILIISIYFKLVRYIKEMSKKSVQSFNKLFRAKRELKLVRRIVVLVIILFTTCFPYKLFVFISFFTPPPKYHFRIAYIFAHMSLMCVMITLLQFTDPLRRSLMKIINGQASSTTTSSV